MIKLDIPLDDLINVSLACNDLTPDFFLQSLIAEIKTRCFKRYENPKSAEEILERSQLIKSVWTKGIEPCQNKTLKLLFLEMALTSEKTGSNNAYSMLLACAKKDPSLLMELINKKTGIKTYTQEYLKAFQKCFEYGIKDILKPLEKKENDVLNKDVLDILNSFLQSLRVNL